jgi:hypothetical protein
MIDLTSIYGSQARQSLDNARQYEAKSIDCRLRELDVLSRLAQNMLQAGPAQELRRELAERMKRAELLAITEVGHTGHV